MTATQGLTAAGIGGLILLILASLATIAIGVAVVAGYVEDRRKEQNRKKTPLETEGETRINNDDSVFFAVEEAQNDFDQ